MWNLNRQGKARFVISGQGQEGTQVGSAWALRARLRHRPALLPRLRRGAHPGHDRPTRCCWPCWPGPTTPTRAAGRCPTTGAAERLNIITGSSPIATQLPHAAGLAQASAIRGDDQVTVCWFGEAASSKGDFHEALNYAGIHRLPVVFVCENNDYAISVTMAKQSAVPDVAARAASYGMPGVIVDGNDTLDVYGAMRPAVARARSGGGPSLVECKTYRLMPHTSDDDDRRYRSPEEVQAWRERDPLPRLRRYLVGQGLLSAEAAEAMELEVRAEIDEAARRAEAAAPPSARDRLPPGVRQAAAAHARASRRRLDEAPARARWRRRGRPRAWSAPCSTPSARRCTT